MVETRWITTAEAAQLSGYHPEYLRELVRMGKIHARKFGPVWQVDEQSLIAYLQASQTTQDRRRGPKT